MRIDRLTSKLQMALSDAQSIALGKDNQFIEPAHLIQALLNQNGSCSALLRQVGVALSDFKAELNKLVEALPQVEGGDADVHMSNDLGRLMNMADKYTQKRGDQYISSEIVLLAAVDDKAALGALLKKFNVNKAALEAAIDTVRGGESVKDQGAEDNREALDKYTVDLTARAAEGKLDPVIGRDDEIRRTVQVLQRRRKNNPVLIGEPGVGKTAIAEG
ncbi:Clp protease N-terminal domain-containing protein, partial [Oleiphilus sp. HI0066]|uniref:Clp protease N-terminal domain-containing protein n=4 Tax=Oleiphilus TaxID=141450 RepID=UPI0026F4566C